MSVNDKHVTNYHTASTLVRGVEGRAFVLNDLKLGKNVRLCPSFQFKFKRKALKSLIPKNKLNESIFLFRRDPRSIQFLVMFEENLRAEPRGA